MALGEYKTGLVKSMVSLEDKEISQSHAQHRNGVTSIQFSPGEQPLCACGSFDRTISIYQVSPSGMSLSYVLKHRFPIIKVDWNCQLHLLAVSYRHHSIVVFNCDPGYCPPDEP